MNTQDIEMFLTIARTKSLSKTAESLYISQSAVSQRLRTLENELGFSLIERTPGQRQSHLTKEGERFRPLAEEIAELMNRSTKIEKEMVIPSLIVGANNSLMNPVLGEYWREVSTRARNDYRVELSTNRSDELYKLLDLRKVDIGLVTEEYVYENINVELLFEEEMLVMMRSREGSETVKVMDPEDLEAASFIDLDYSNHFNLWEHQWWPPNVARMATTDNPAMLHYLLNDDRSWVFCPASMRAYFLEIGNFSFFKLDPAPPTRSVYAITHRFPHHAKKDAIGLFLNNLREHIDVMRAEGLVL